MKALINRITKEILAQDSNVRRNAQFCKLEHHDGVISVTRWGDYASYSRTQAQANIQTFNGEKLHKSSAIKYQVQEFLEECQAKGLPL